ncbi:hypothetical protein [Allosalinactinospora lopnorensis]|uniref:hypothetical protein n=1 Tax=Allosalinactinospora lopnorensis TaxID=1352348 RepID=UPI000623D250|nr:hypothetical protein [Allosalinactinospora lopnorensis]
MWDPEPLGVDLRWGVDRLLYGHAGCFDTAQRLARLAGVDHLTALGDVVVADPYGLLRIMSSGDGRAREHHDGSIEVYLDSEGTTLTLWPLSPFAKTPVRRVPSRL